MNSLFDDIGLLTKRALAFVATRGAAATAVAIAAGATGGTANAILPVVGVAVGVPITAATIMMTHDHREQKIINNFRKEIAANFQIAPDEVTHDHLRTLAYGNEKTGTPPHAFFEQIVQKYDNDQAISIGSNILSAVMTSAFVAVKGQAVLSAMSAVLGTGALPLVGLMVAAGAVMFATDKVLNGVGHQMFGDTERTGYDAMMTLAKQRERGVSVLPEQVLGVYAAYDPQLKQEIAEGYGDAKFSTLPLKAREELVARYDEKYGITEKTERINNNTLRITSLAYTPEERQAIMSSRRDAALEVAPELDVVEPQVAASQQMAAPVGIGGHLSQTYHRAKEQSESHRRTEEVLRGDHIVDTQEIHVDTPERDAPSIVTAQATIPLNGGFVERVGGARVREGEEMSHVEMVGGSQRSPEGEDMSHVERMQQRSRDASIGPADSQLASF